MFSRFVDQTIKQRHIAITKGFTAPCTGPNATQNEMRQTASLLQSEITPEWANLSTILALVCEWQKTAIHAADHASDFALPGATQLPGGGASW